MKIKTFISGTAIFISICLSTSAFAKSNNQYELKDLSWLTGTWLDSPKQYKEFETLWSPVRGNSMVGTTRVVWKGELAFYEILTMIQNSEGIFYRFDYYNKKLDQKSDQKSGQKSEYKMIETNRFKLIHLEHQKAVFKHMKSNDELTLEITKDGLLQGAWLDKSKPGNKAKIGYRLTKQNN